MTNPENVPTQRVAHGMSGLQLNERAAGKSVTLGTRAPLKEEEPTREVRPNREVEEE